MRSSGRGNCWLRVLIAFFVILFLETVVAVVIALGILLIIIILFHVSITLQVHASIRVLRLRSIAMRRRHSGPPRPPLLCRWPWQSLLLLLHRPYASSVKRLTIHSSLTADARSRGGEARSCHSLVATGWPATAAEQAWPVHAALLPSDRRRRHAEKPRLRALATGGRWLALTRELLKRSASAGLL